MKKTALIVDDEPDLTEVISFQLNQMGIQTLEAHSGSEALSILQENPSIDLVISDVRMPSGGGIDLMKKVKKNWPSIPVVLMSGFADVMEEEAKAMGAAVLLQKPMDLSQIGEWVQKLLDL